MTHLKEIFPCFFFLQVMVGVQPFGNDMNRSLSLVDLIYRFWNFGGKWGSQGLMKLLENLMKAKILLSTGRRCSESPCNFTEVVGSQVHPSTADQVSLIWKVEESWGEQTCRPWLRSVQSLRRGYCIPGWERSVAVTLHNDVAGEHGWHPVSQGLTSEACPFQMGFRIVRAF